ncbi:MAG: VPLPA-CTERM sorting domain-containing protein [Gammaproteobacteria bacterium]|nr:VPLPA-CTERM sorting domain-containing protein [Gammaproteobacteria bacterium]
MKKIKSILCLLILISGSANAALINLTVNGTVDGALNWGGLSAGNTITADLTLDTASYTGNGYETFYFTGDNTLAITAGSFSFDQSMDSALNASIAFNDGVMVDFNFGALFGINGAPEEFDSAGLYVLADRSVTIGNGNNKVTTDYLLAAHWEAATLTAVPVPAAVWLFGSGLLGLAGVARRKAA